MPMLENRCIVDRCAHGGHDVLKRAFATAVLIAIAVACSPSPSEPPAVQSQAQPRWLTLPPPLPLPAAVSSSSAHVNEIDPRLAEDYRRLSPTPDNFETFSAEIGQMWATQPRWTEADLARIGNRVAIADGDHEEMVFRPIRSKWRGKFPARN
jgi:hypothetical protein